MTVKQHDRVTALVKQLGLAPHPEGGFFREFFRSGRSVVQESPKTRRTALTGIYYLLAAGQHSRWHRVASDEQWTFLEGEPLELLMAEPDGGAITSTRVGPLALGCEPVLVVPGGHWQATRPTGAYGLVTCTVAPGFEFADFEFLANNPKAAAALSPLLGESRTLL